LRRANHVIAVSDTVARAIETRFDSDSERISVVYPPIRDLGGESDPDMTPLTMGRPFFLAVGTLEPRKNLDCVLEAHRLAYRETGIPLYLAGTYGWNQEGLVRRIRDSGGAARWLGGVPDSTLAALYRQAVALVAFGREEGFDYPSVEALSFGTPVILSDIPVHREIVGDPGLYAPPDEPEILGRRMLEAAAMSTTDRAIFREAARGRIDVLRRRGSAMRYREIYKRVVG
jgi:alpha-1,3-rhamnosyl/mannosyltransferase